jgi:hypothetical protein
MEWDAKNYTMINSERPITSEAHSYIGQYACHTGLTTGTSCGYVKAAEVTVEGNYFEGKTIVVKHLSELYPVCNVGGDSGGPVYSGNTALGITSFADDKLPECEQYDLFSEITEDTDYLGVTVAPRQFYPNETQTDISVAGYLHGQPGSVTVNGHVKAAKTVNGLNVQVRYSKLEGGVYVYKRSEYPTVKNGFYEFQNEPVGPGTWKVKAAFSSQGEYTGSESAESAAFTIKNTPWYSEGFADGYISRDPDISSWAPGRLDIFGVGADGKTLYHKWYSGGAWSGWEPRTTGYSSGVGAVSWGYNRLDVVGKRASDGTVAHEYWTGTSWQKDNLGGYILSDPDISSWGSGRLDVFALGADGKTLFHKWFTEGAGWSAWEERTTGYSSSPSAVSWGYNRIDVVAKRASDGSVSHEYWDGTSWQKDNLGGYVNGAPEITSWGPGRLDVFALGADSKTMYHKWFTTAEGWSEWEALGTGYSSSPGAVSWGYNRLDVVGIRGSDNGIKHEYWAP